MMTLIRGRMRMYPRMILAFLLALRAWCQTDPGIPDLTTRESARSWFNAWWPKTYGAAMNFTGDVLKGDPGDISPEFRNQALLRYNIFRRMVGSQPFVLDEARNKEAQLAAMIIAVNGKMAHGIDSTWKFYSDAANKATMDCLEALTYSDPTAAVAYLYDFGNTGSVGHRISIVGPSADVGIGLGNVAATSTTQQAEALSTYNRPLGTPLNFDKLYFSWPSAGYTPNYLITGQWSIDISDSIAADWNQTLTFRDVQVTVTRNGVPVNVTGGGAKNGGGAVWTIDGTADGSSDYSRYNLVSTGESFYGRPNFPQDIVYHVKLTGVRYRVEDPTMPGTGKDIGSGAPYNGTGVIEYDVIGYNPDLATTLTVLSAPVSQTVSAGRAATLTVTASGVSAYQWYKDWTPISGATQSWLQITNFQASNAGSYHCLMSGPGGYILSGYATLALAALDSQRIANISTRSYVNVNDQIQVAGFVIEGTQPKTVLIRAAGPALAGYGVTGTLADPVLSLFDSNQTLITSNDDWYSDAAVGSAIEAVASQVGAFGFTHDSKDAALLVALQPGHYTAQVAGKSGATGVALVEVYDAADTGATRLLNISSRTLVRPGDNNSQVAGFVISGNASKTVLIRAAGPALAPFGVSGTLSDPALKLYDSTQQVIDTNDDWADGTDQASVKTNAAAKVGAFSFPVGSKDAAILVTLSPGLYSAQVSAKGSDSGVALVEVYEVPSNERSDHL